MNGKMILYILGNFMLVSAILLFLPVAVALIYGDNTVFAFAVPILISLVFGSLFGIKKPKNSTIYAKEGFVTVALSWILLSILGAIPYYISLKIPFLDCIFETASGLTTTGASIMQNVEALPNSINFWRCFTHWIGGMGVLVFMLAIIPLSDSYSFHLMRAEVPGPKVGKLVSKVKFTSRILYGIYIVLTIFEIILLILGGMPVFDSIVNSFATAGTGGFAIKNISVAYYNSAYFDYVIGTFMIIFGINFNLFYLILIGNAAQALKSEELRWYLSIIAFAVISITINISSLYESIGESIRYAFFQVSSIITTTGFSTTDFNLWPNYSRAVLVTLMFFGACAGSTGGGIKISRIVILCKIAVREIKYMISPRSVISIKSDKQALEHPVVRGVSSFFVAYMMIGGASVLLLTLDKLDLTSSFTAVVACLNNIGPGLEVVGPSSNYSNLSELSKSVLIFDMLAGRLELFPILMLFSPKLWKGHY